MPLDLKLDLHKGIHDIIQRSHSFSEICTQLFSVCGQNRSLVLDVGEQEGLRDKLMSFSSSGEQGQQKLWLTPALISQWLIVLAHCEKSLYRDELLQQEAEMISNVKEKLNSEQIDAMVSNLPSLSDSTNIKSVYINLLSHFAQDVEKSYSLTLQQMSILLRSFKDIDMVDCDWVPSVLAKLLKHIEKYTHGQQWFDAEQLSRIFWGLQYMMELPSVLAILDSLVPHIKANKTVDNRYLATLLQASRNMADNEVFTKVVKAVTEHSRHNAEEAKWLTSEHLAPILNSLQNRREGEVVDDLLKVMLLHIQGNRVGKQKFSVADIENILLGLRHLANSSTACQIIQLLSDHLSLPVINVNKDRLKKWLANVAYHLSSYMDQAAPAEAQKAAEVFVKSAQKLLSSIVTISLNFDKLRAVENRHQQIFQLGMFIDLHSREVDLREFVISTDFAIVLRDFLLREKENELSWTVVFDHHYDSYQKQQIQAIFTNKIPSIKFITIAPARTKRPFSAIMSPNINMPQMLSRKKPKLVE